eukprot:TRINITY_DN27594_c0_g1_i1.p1 TRINITY_DN27594_c0_g1~~TRINITY_DN27594_c0_g1_i1.p1  ORF type:complete len:446 (+),score=84.73 TRINITY_DN27594_c0_g1_i1:32-1339(+)
MEKIINEFSQLGHTSDGVIQKQALAKVLLRLGMTQSEADQLFKELYFDNDRIVLAEFLLYLEAVSLEAKTENGNNVILDKILASSDKWAALNRSRATAPAVGSQLSLAVVADQDEASREGVEGKVCEKWVSQLALCKLTYRGNLGQGSYTFEWKSEARLITTRADKSFRGAEYSTLEVFEGKLLTACDRTGNVDELIPQDGGKTFDVQPLRDTQGNAVVCHLGDGKKDKPLKAEWCTQKDGKLLIGSTGKERTDDDGNVVHEGEMWVKHISSSSLGIVHHDDWRPRYNTLRKAAICPHGAGYIVHEACRWSEIHKMWFFLPRKLSRERYDEIIDAGKCVNLMLAVPDNGSDSDVLMQSYLTMAATRGCSDFLFVPGTGDCHILVMRTSESLDNDVDTYVSVIDLEANVLMPEQLIAKNRKFEGAAWVDRLPGLKF